MREKLIERVAKHLFSVNCGTGWVWEEWADQFREDAIDVIEPVEEFVAEWLATEPDDGHRPALPTLAADWRADILS